MATSDLIARFIAELLDDADGCAEVQRASLADKFGCVPSQINYVISTRFSPEHGYIVESRRGGGGYIRITRVRIPRGQMIMHTVNAVGEELGCNEAAAFLSNLLDAAAVDERDLRLIQAAIGNNALRAVEPDARERVRAQILKHMLLSLLAE